MTMEPDAIEPEIGELFQEESPGPAVPVRPVGPVTVHPLPARTAHSRNLSVSNVGEPEQIANEDLRRAYIVIVTATNPLRVGHEKQAVIDGVAAILPVDTPLRLETSAPVWVLSNGAAAAVVSYWSANWAD